MQCGRAIVVKVLKLIIDDKQSSIVVAVWTRLFFTTKSKEGSVAQWIEHQTMNTWMTPRRGFEPLWCQISASLLVPLSKVLYSNCSVIRRSCKAIGPVYMYLNINTSTLKNVTGYSKRAGDHPGTVDCTSKLHSSTLGLEEKYSLSVCSAEILTT